MGGGSGGHVLLFAVIRFEKQFNHAWEIEKHKIWDARLAQKTGPDPILFV